MKTHIFGSVLLVYSLNGPWCHLIGSVVAKSNQARDYTQVQQ